ncbi:DUF2291 family protein [Oceanicella sp. SM1341]|uniref:DUF2291 family protein n=1 Tax=Oceanicella sp. SM1341 TaxID=1548889 RepID=UPI000E5191D1|nr:DUF2291 domain-containing protein [Oceanicella sp. SM1341]
MLRWLCLALILPALAGCKIVPDPDPTAADGSGGGGAQQTDEQRMEARVAADWEETVLPALAQETAAFAEVKPALAAGLDSAGERFGVRPAAGSAPWNFVVSGQGTVVASKLDSRAASMDLDTDGDGAADIRVQLGPIVRGTGLRDALTVYDFTAFRDQIEFAKLARALNDRAVADIAKPEADPAGATYAFTGVITPKAGESPIPLVPVTLEAR